MSKEHGKLVVVEGILRLPAVKLLMEPETCTRLNIKADWNPSTQVRESLKKLPIIVRPRAEIWDYIDLKHLNGPQPWASIAKAQYIHRVHTSFGVPLDHIANLVDYAASKVGFEMLTKVAARWRPVQHAAMAVLIYQKKKLFSAQMRTTGGPPVEIDFA